jgi:hypothetical protein
MRQRKLQTEKPKAGNTSYAIKELMRELEQLAVEIFGRDAVLCHEGEH